MRSNRTLSPTVLVISILSIRFYQLGVKRVAANTRHWRQRVEIVAAAVGLPVPGVRSGYPLPGVSSAAVVRATSMSSFSHVRTFLCSLPWKQVSRTTAHGARASRRHGLHRRQKQLDARKCTRRGIVCSGRCGNSHARNLVGVLRMRCVATSMASASQETVLEQRSRHHLSCATSWMFALGRPRSQALRRDGRGSMRAEVEHATGRQRWEATQQFCRHCAFRP